jgi:hypothetical protein
MYQSVEERVKLSREFGRIIHSVAVRVARKNPDNEGKSELARRIGTEKSVIQEITQGNAHMHDPDLLGRLIEAVSGEVDEKYLRRLEDIRSELAMN